MMMMMMMMVMVMMYISARCANWPSRRAYVVLIAQTHLAASA